MSIIYRSVREGLGGGRIGVKPEPKTVRPDGSVYTQLEPDVSVIGHDMGRRAFDLLAARLSEGRDRPAEKVLIDGALIVRASVRAK